MGFSAAKLPYAGYRFLGEVISHAVWSYFRVPLSLRMVEEMLAARGTIASHETVQWFRVDKLTVPLADTT
jgi:transposase-like protein